VLLTHLDSTTIAPYDVVVVGTSFAALPLARALSPTRRVLLVEGGDMLEHDSYRELTQSDEYGHFSDGYWAAHWIRAAGGTSSRWSGVVVPLDARDLDGSNGRPAWPLSLDDLMPWYLEAAGFLGRSGAVCAPARPWLDGLLYKPLSHDTPRRLAGDVSALAPDQRLDVVLKHTVIRLEAPTRRHVTGLVVTDASRVTRSIDLRQGQVVVLACGGLGNAQILLQPAPGTDAPVGNESGLVGRFLMEHPHVICAQVMIDRARLPTAPEAFGPALPAVALADDLHREHDLLACSLAIQGPVDAPEAADERTYFELTFGRPLEHAIVFARSEQEPAATNRAEVVPDRNWAGALRLRTHCSFSSRDLRTIEVASRLLGERLLTARAGVLRLRNTAIYRETSGGGHTMGTTRMGDDPATSVCDAHQRVHGYDNLYLSGSSVFPTGGAANPTLTIVALALRLADHLARTGA
jgi:hypothetical protein